MMLRAYTYNRRMRSASRLLAVLFFLLMGAPDETAQGQESGELGEYETLLARRHQLEEKLAVLKRERDFLLFQRVLERSDSKYLILDLREGKGTLKYRHRVLRNFDLSRAGDSSRDLNEGMITLTEKRDRYGRRKMIVFGDELILQEKSRNPPPGTMPMYALGSKDLAALFYAMDVGAKAFILTSEAVELPMDEEHVETLSPLDE